MKVVFMRLGITGLRLTAISLIFFISSYANAGKKGAACLVLYCLSGFPSSLALPDVQQGGAQDYESLPPTDQDEIIEKRELSQISNCIELPPIPDFSSLICSAVSLSCPPVGIEYVDTGQDGWTLRLSGNGKIQSLETLKCRVGGDDVYAWGIAQYFDNNQWKVGSSESGVCAIGDYIVPLSGASACTTPFYEVSNGICCTSATSEYCASIDTTDPSCDENSHAPTSNAPSTKRPTSKSPTSKSPTTAFPTLQPTTFSPTRSPTCHQLVPSGYVGSQKIGIRIGVKTILVVFDVYKKAATVYAILNPPSAPVVEGINCLGDFLLKLSTSLLPVPSPCDDTKLIVLEKALDAIHDIQEVVSGNLPPCVGRRRVLMDLSICYNGTWTNTQEPCQNINFDKPKVSIGQCSYIKTKKLALLAKKWKKLCLNKPRSSSRAFCRKNQLRSVDPCSL